MKSTFLVISLVLASLQFAIAQSDIDPSHIGVYVTPYYNSQGPIIKVGRFSAGLASKDEKTVVSTIFKMKASWQNLTFPELYVAAIRLYDLGYRKESVYWFYTAQFRGRQFGMLRDESSAGGIGDPGFEVFHAQDAFYELVGPYINGYAFGDPDGLIKVIERVQKEGRKIPDLKTTYPHVKFKGKSVWESTSAKLANGMSELIKMIKDRKADIKRQREEQGLEAKYAKLKNKELTNQ